MLPSKDKPSGHFDNLRGKLSCVESTAGTYRGTFAGSDGHSYALSNTSLYDARGNLLSWASELTVPHFDFLSFRLATLK